MLYCSRCGRGSKMATSGDICGAPLRRATCHGTFRVDDRCRICKRRPFEPCGRDGCPRTAANAGLLSAQTGTFKAGE